MNESKPDWYRMARGSANRSPVFTEEMKREVNRRIAEGGARIRHWQRWLSAGAAMLVLATAVVWTLNRPVDEYAENANVPKESFALTFMTGDKLPGDSSSSFETAPMQRLSKSSVEIVSERNFPGVGTLYSYRLEGDSEVYRIGLSFEDGLMKTPSDSFYEYGYAYPDAFELSASSLFGEKRAKMYAEPCNGSPCVYTDWISFDSGVPVVDLHLDVPTIERDLDGDGRMELIASIAGKSGNAFVYKKIGGELRYADIGRSLGAQYPDSVSFDAGNGTFNLVTAEDIRSYEYSADGDRLERIDAPPVDVSPMPSEPALFDGNRSVQLAIGGYSLYAQWFQDPLQSFGLYLPDSAVAIQEPNGRYRYEVLRGKGSVIFRDGPPDVAYVYENDMSRLSNYAGTASMDVDGAVMRTDYFVVEKDEDHRVYIEISYKPADKDKVRPILLAMVANVKFSPEPIYY